MVETYDKAFEQYKLFNEHIDLIRTAARSDNKFYIVIIGAILGYFLNLISPTTPDNEIYHISQTALVFCLVCTFFWSESLRIHTIDLSNIRDPYNKLTNAYNLPRIYELSMTNFERSHFRVPRLFGLLMLLILLFMYSQKPIIKIWDIPKSFDCGIQKIMFCSMYFFVLNLNLAQWLTEYRLIKKKLFATKERKK